MERIITYTTEDGRIFPDRAAARQHEVEVQRRKRVSACLQRILGAADETASHPLQAVVDAICRYAAEVAEAMSARAAVRAAKRGGSPTPKDSKS